ncbi:hypothetical protein PP353_gp35 [Arthrobacter phage Kumotta]|uniref:Uncharacterized protein n=1 Tax=Arthrobacter phage Kumotta TaxID=2588498 RepID=A0A4Y6ENA4_9CAUD|nr:hypothetical protein PP353_gp35 [Arthrobacter phage Kumotta]QDF19545.1 hypothetical protein SEA_KUMOTTA_35 [Arthrobacter phage Kumotta]
MPTYTTTGYEKRIKAELDQRQEHWSKSKIQRAALKLCKEQARMESLDWERIFTHSDPTPKQAIRNIEREAEEKAASAATPAAQTNPYQGVNQ